MGYYFKGFLYGFIRSFGNRIGETVFLTIIVYGFYPIWTFNFSPYYFIISSIITIFIIWESFSKHEIIFLEENSNLFKGKKKYHQKIFQKKFIILIYFFLKTYLYLLYFLFILYMHLHIKQLFL